MPLTRQTVSAGVAAIIGLNSSFSGGNGSVMTQPGRSVGKLPCALIFPTGPRRIGHSGGMQETHTHTVDVWVLCSDEPSKYDGIQAATNLDDSLQTTFRQNPTPYSTGDATALYTQSEVKMLRYEGFTYPALIFQVKVEEIAGVDWAASSPLV